MIIGLSVHVLPFAACTTLIVLNLRTHYAGKDVSTTSLQFLAKLLELLAQASISNMALVYLRSLYLGGHPVPFGTLFAGLQITSLNYLWSLEFLGSTSSKYLDGKRKLAFIGFVACNLLLAAAIGPSIAVCLIPKRQFSQLRSVSVWTNSNYEETFPSNLSDADTRCITGDALSKCSWEAFPAIFQASYYPGTFKVPLLYDPSSVVELENLDPQDTESTMAGGLQSSIFRYLNNDDMPGAARLATTPTVSALVLSEFALRDLDWEYASFKNMWGIQMRYLNSQSMVGAICSRLEWPISNTSIVLQNAFDLKNSTISLNPLELPVYDRNSTSWTITWFDAPDNTPQLSLVAVVLPPAHLLGKQMADYINQTETVFDNLDGTFQAEACLFAAGWAESRVQVELHADLTGTIVASNMTKAPDKAIKISKDWAASLIGGWKTAEGQSALDFIMPGILAQAPDSGSTAFLANILTHAMSRILPRRWPSLIELISNDDEKSKELMEKSLTPTKGRLHLDYHIYYEGLTYSPYGLPVTVSLIILLIYCLYVVIYTTIMFINPLSSSAWDSIAELTALAILSAPTDKLHNTSAGIELLDTFREPVNIRAAGSDHLEIVFHNDEKKRGTDTVQNNKRY